MYIIITVVVFVVVIIIITGLVCRRGFRSGVCKQDAIIPPTS